MRISHFGCLIHRFALLQQQAVFASVALTWRHIPNASMEVLFVVPGDEAFHLGSSLFRKRPI